MKKYKLLTDGKYDELEDCVGKVVEGFEFNERLIGVPIIELIRVGAKGLEDSIDGSLSFYNGTEVKEVIGKVLIN